MEGIMEIKDLTVSYRKNPYIHQLNGMINDHKFTAIIGKNGSGKSTLLRALAKLHDEQTGQLIVDGRDLFELKQKDFAKQLTLLPQAPQTKQEITVYQLVSMGRYPHQTGRRLSKEDDEKILASLQAVNMLAFKNESLSSLSGGQRQRVWFALALAQETPYLLLDEPTTYLDLEGQLEILTLLKRLHQQTQKTIVMVHHDVNQVARFCDDVMVMKDGQLIQAGTVQEVMTSERLSDIYHLKMTVAFDEHYQCPQVTYYDLLEE